jgi:hypothetical protein
MELKIKMISSATRILSFIKENPLAIDEEIFQHVSDYISEEGVKDEKIRRGMIASASRTLNLARKNQNLSEKEILKRIIEEIPSISANLDEEY